MSEREHAEGAASPERDDTAGCRRTLLAAIEDLERRWPLGRSAARRVAVAFDTGSAASTEDLDALTELSSTARDLAVALSELLHEEIPATRDGLAHAAEAIRRDLAEDAVWLRRLALIDGPAPVGEAVHAVRELARRALEEPEHVAGDAVRGLAALHRLITLGNDRRSGSFADYQDIAAAESTARSTLPPEAQATVVAAVVGELRIPDDAPTDAAPLPGRVPDAGPTGAPVDAVRAVVAGEPDRVTGEPGDAHVAAAAATSRADVAEPVAPADRAAAATDATGTADGVMPVDRMAEEDAIASGTGSGACADAVPTAGSDRSAEIEEPAAPVRPAVPRQAGARERGTAPPPAGTVPSPSGAAPDGEVDLSDLDELLASGSIALPRRPGVSAGAGRSTEAERRDDPGSPGEPGRPDGAGRIDQAEQAGRARPAGHVGSPAQDGRIGAPAPPPNGAPRGSTVPATGAPRAGDVAAESLTAVESDLLAQGRFGLAADLRAAAGADRAGVAARRLAALATWLRHPTGALAAAFAHEATFVRRERLADDRVGQIVAWAAAVRIAVLSPSAGAAGILAELAPCVAGHPALTDVGQAFAEASRAGVIVMPEAADAVSALADAEARASDQARAARRLLENATVRTIKYAPANGVYQAWMSPTGHLGPLLDLVAGNDHKNADDVLRQVVALRGQVEKEIDETFAAQRQRNIRVRIVAGARATLRQRFIEVVDTAAAWAEAVKEAAVASAAGGPAQVWQATPLTRLRRRLAGVRSGLVPEGERLRGELGSAGAVAAALRLLNGALDTCDGRPPRGSEVIPAYALHEELLASDLHLNPAELIPEGGLGTAVLPDLIRLAGGTAADPVTVYDRRAAAGDHDLTAVLIEAVGTFDRAAATALRERRDADVRADEPEIARGIAAIIARIDARRMAGTLDDESWSVLASRAAALTVPGRRDYGRIRRELAAVEEELDRQRDKKIASTLHRIDDLASTSPGVRDAAGTLTDLARKGQVASAEEYLEQVRTGGTLPTGTDDSDHLVRFFPAIPDACASHPRLLSHLRSALAREQGRPAREDQPAHPAVEALKAATGVDPASLSRGRAESGVQAVNAWMALRNPKQRPEVSSALRPILDQAGLEFRRATIQHGTPAGRTWVRLDGVRGNGSARTPTLGSAMSASGDTLRVVLIRSSVSPATVVEWMTDEPADETVLALWLPGSLSAAERRSLADASRGRPKPPLLMLDEAALAYLICQPEPRRSTFAAITLPFTAASPYRDTPGYTAPEMFYGRTEELAAIKDLTGPSIVYGGRQLGKSALLRTAKRQFDDGADRRAVLVSIFTVGGDADPERLWNALWPALAALGIVPERPPAGDPAELVHRAIVAWTGERPGRALLVLLDEADAFLEADAAANRFTNVDWCRRIMLDTEHRAKFVFAGLHRTARFDSLPNQPLAHFGQPVSVGPLGPQAAHDLLARPLAALGFRFEDPVAVPARVLALANNMPALLQLFGAALVAHLTAHPVPPDGPPTAVTGEDIDDVFGDAKLRNAFREKYIHTLNLDHRYLVIAYVVAYAAHQDAAGGRLTLAELSEQARAAWPAGFARCGADDFRSLVTECVDLGVLAVDDGGYRIRTPSVLRLLGTEEEVFETLTTAPERLKVQSPADGAAYRRRIRNSDQRMPLTERQIGEVFKARDRVLVISGSPALGIERAVASLDQAKQEGHSRLSSLRRLPNLSPTGLEHAVSMLTGGHALIAADLRMSTPAVVANMIAAGEEAIGQYAGPLTIVLVTWPASAPAWIRHGDRIDLALVDEVGLRLWSDEDNLPFHDDDARGELLNRTGGWPLLLAKVAEQARTGHPVKGPDEMLDGLDRWISSPAGAAALVKAAGLGGDTAGSRATGPDGPGDAVASTLARVFGLLAELTEETGGEPRDDLVELLSMDPEPAESAHGAGFDDLAQTVDVLGALGCVTVDDSGALRTEPVLTRAFRTVRAGSA